MSTKSKAMKKSGTKVNFPKVTMKREWREGFDGYLFALPGLLLLISFLIVPMALALYYSFTNFYLLTPEKTQLIGLENYKYLFEDSLFLTGLKNTIYFVFIVVPLQTSVALGLALLINNKLKFVSFFRTAFFSPVVMSMVVLGILWTFLYNPENGLINSMLSQLGLPTFAFLTDPDQAMNSIIIMSVWQGAGYQMMIFLAGLQDIPDHLYEAASIDGANRWQKFINITIPGLKNVSIFVVVVTTIMAFKLFVQPYVMTQGGPMDSTKTLVYLIYEYGFKFRDVGYSATISIVFFLFVLSVSLIQRKLVSGEKG